jgi:uncharacterized protein YbjT (DUF2867 family)
MYFLAGVSGHVGSVAATELLAKGAKIRALVHDEKKAAPWREKGADVRVGSLTDVPMLTRALTGVEGAFVLLPPPRAPETTGSAAAVLAYMRGMASAIAQAVRASKVPHVVMLSSIGAHVPEGTGPIQGLHGLERELARTGARHTFIRASFFMENHAAAAGAVVTSGVFPNFAPENVPMHQVATQDIGLVVVRALQQPSTHDATINLIGPKDYTATEVKDAFARAAGKPVQFANMPIEAAEGAMLKAGMPPGLAALYAEMYRALASGRVAYEPGAPLTRGSVGLDEVIGPIVKSARAAH